MKKKLLATLSIVMALSLTACSGETVSTGSSVTDTEIEVNDDTEADEAEETEETEAAEADAEDDLAVAEEEAPKQNGVFGYVDGILYTNEFFGLKYLAGPGYMFLDDSMIGRITDAGSEMMGDDSLTERLESGATVIDFAVTDTMMTSSVNFVIGQHDNNAPEMSREELEERIDMMIPLQVERYENMGATDIVCERSTATFLGEEVPCITLKVNYLGNEINMLMTFIIKDNYSATITVQAATDEKISQLLSFFVPIQ